MRQTILSWQTRCRLGYEAPNNGVQALDLKLCQRTNNHTQKKKDDLDFAMEFSANRNFQCFGMVLLILLPISVRQIYGAPYIVLMDPSKMPAAIAQHQHWYSSAAAGPLTHVYHHTCHGFSAQMNASQVAAVQKMHGFVAIFEDGLINMHTTRSPDFLSLSSLSPNAIWPQTDYGNGAIIGMVDTGVWPESRSFKDTGFGPIPKKWKGICEEGDGFNASHCNRKLVGARYFYQGLEAQNGSGDYKSARDVYGHGSHTASIAAGNSVSNASCFGFAAGTASGMAPKARIASYKVCWKDGGCSMSDVVAAFDQAVADGVDVISFSLGESPKPYYQDVVAIAAFGAFKHGVFVSAAAGNSGPNSSTVTNNAPWITTVGAGSLDRSFPAHLLLGNGRTFRGQSLNTGKTFHNRQIPLVYFDLCLPENFNRSSVEKKIVVCGDGGAVLNYAISGGLAISEAGGAGMISVMPPEAGNSIFTYPYTLPAMSVTSNTGLELKKYINSKSTRIPTAAIRFSGKTVLGTKPAPQVAYYSSRGPNSIIPAVLKPDVIAPGGNILAAWSGYSSPVGLDGDERRVEYNLDYGTSMSCPHISGIAALLKSAHPNWSPAAIKSAIMTTADTTDHSGNSISEANTGKSADAFAYGAGHVNPQRALSPGLVYDLTEQDYIDLLCGQGYNSSQVGIIAHNSSLSCPSVIPRAEDFNYPSLTAVLNGAKSTIFGRKVTNVGYALSTYTAIVTAPKELSVKVKPSKLAFSNLNRTLSFELHVSVLTQASGSHLTGSLAWSDGAHIVRSPITIVF